MSAAGRRLLVISNETAEGAALHEAIRFRARNVEGEVLVVAPALNSRARLDRCVERLRSAGVPARGEAGDADPLQAIAVALRGFAADEILIATHPAARSNWLAHDVIDRARLRFDVPVLHVVVGSDLDTPPPVPWHTAPTLKAS